MLICLGVAAYPVGWYTPEIRDACGDEADIFNLGNKWKQEENNERKEKKRKKKSNKFLSLIRSSLRQKWIILPAGDCQLSWSCYLMAASVGVLLMCVGLSVKASKVKPGSIRL